MCTNGCENCKCKNKENHNEIYEEIIKAVNNKNNYIFILNDPVNGICSKAMTTEESFEIQHDVLKDMDIYDEYVHFAGKISLNMVNDCISYLKSKKDTLEAELLSISNNIFNLTNKSKTLTV